MASTSTRVLTQLAHLKEYLLAKPGAAEETPFGPDALVYKVGGKMFALVAWELDPLRITLKCEPVEAIALRQQYDAVQPGYYMNKRHWNTVELDGTMPADELRDMIDDSYDLVFGGLTKAKQREILGER